MRIGLTGASGFIGSALRQALESRGDDVVRFVRPGARTGVDTVRWAPATGDLDRTELERVGPLDAIVNLAGVGIGDRRWSDARRQQIVSSRLDATHLITAIAREFAVPHLVSASAVGYYGSRADEVLDESSTPGDGFLARLCVDWEDAAAPGETLRVSHLRTGIVLDRRGGALKRQLTLFEWGLGGRLGSGDQWLSPISLRDAVRAILWVLDTVPTGPVNLVAPECVRNSDFTRVLAHALRRPAVLAVPAFTLRLVLGADLADELILASQRVTPHVLLERGFSFADATLSEILSTALATTS